MCMGLRLSHTTAAIAAGMALLIAFAVAPLSLVAYGQTAGPLPLCAPGSTVPGCNSTTGPTPYRLISGVGLGAFPVARAMQYRAQESLPSGVSTRLVTLSLSPQVLAAAGGDPRNVVVVQQRADRGIEPVSFTLSSDISTMTLNVIPGATYIIAAVAPTSLQSFTGIVQSYQAASGRLVLQTTRGLVTVLVLGSRAVSYIPGMRVAINGVPSFTKIDLVLGVSVRPLNLVLPLALPHTGLGGTALQLASGVISYAP
jgi:hypothetical protein